MKTFEYLGCEITFSQEGKFVMVNATEMAKYFNRKPESWLRTQPSRDFISALSVAHMCASDDLIQVRKGGFIQGTWMHEDVAIEFARWLAPEFGIWCNNRIKELLKHGMTALPSTIDEMISNPDLVIKLATELKRERELKTKAMEHNRQLHEKITSDEPKVVFADSVTGSNNLILVREYAKILCDNDFEIGEKRLYKWFRDNGYMNHKNEPYQEFINMGVFEVIERTFGGPDGTFTKTTTKVTGKGQTYFAKKIKGN